MKWPITCAAGTKTASRLRNSVYECVYEAVLMEMEPAPVEPTQIPVEMEEAPPEKTVDEQFTERLASLAVDLDKIERKRKVFLDGFAAHGEDVAYSLGAADGERQLDNLVRGGLEVAEQYMRVLIELDGFVGMQPENRERRKALVVDIQKHLDEMEELNKKVNVTKMRVTKELAERKAAERAKREAEEKAKAEAEQARLEEERWKEEEQKREEAEEAARTAPAPAAAPHPRGKRRQKAAPVKAAPRQNQRYTKPVRDDVESESDGEEEETQAMPAPRLTPEEVVQAIDWSQMHFKPKFEVREVGNGIAVFASIPAGTVGRPCF